MRWIRRLFQKSRSEKQLDQELRFHLDQQIADYVEAGIPLDEARRRARLDFGGLERVKEEVRDTRWETRLDSLFRDIRYAFRSLRKDRRFVLTAILALALGIGATTAMFSLVYNLLIDPLPYKGGNRLTVVKIHDMKESDNRDRESFSIPEFIDCRTQNHVFEDVVGSYNLDVLYDDGKGLRKTGGAFVTTNTFEFFGVPPLLGRGLTQEDGNPGAPPVFVMNYRLWQGEFSGDSIVVGKTLLVNGKPRTLVGVMPPRFQAYGARIWLPLGLYPGAEGTAAPGNLPVYLWTLGRLKPGTSLRAAAADLDVIARRLSKFYPKEYPEQFTVTTQSEVEAVMGDFRTMLYALLVAVFMLLLIACSNIASLLLARATVRQREIAIRASLGASRGRLIRQLLVESFVLSAGGCALGCWFAYFGLKGLMAIIPQGPLPDEADVGLNAAVLLFALGITVLTTILNGLTPALHTVRGDLYPRLTASGKSVSGDFRHGNLRAGLVIVEVALSIVLLAGAGLLMRTCFALAHVDLGYKSKNALLVRLLFPEGHADTADQKGIFFRQVLDRVTSLPGVTSAAETVLVPPYEGWQSGLTVAGKPGFEKLTSFFDMCSEGYFQTLGIPLVRGRLLSKNDVDSARRVAVVSQTFAHIYFFQDDPIGHKFKFNVFDQVPELPHDTYFEIIGVVGDVLNQGLQTSPIPQVYIPYTTTGFGNRAILIRTTVPPSSLVAAVREQIRAVDRDVALQEAKSLESYLYERSYQTPQFGLTTLGTFAGIGLLLAIIGVFSVMAYNVSLQTHEIGVRMALGAQQSKILTMILTKGMRLVASGVVIGFVASYGLTRFLASQIWGVSATDPWTFGTVAAIILTVGLAACLLPARRATQVDPLIALRYE